MSAGRDIPEPLSSEALPRLGVSQGTHSSVRVWTVPSRVQTVRPGLAFRQCVQVRALAVFDKLASTKGQRAGHSMCAEDLVQGERARCTRVKTQESRLKTRCYTAASRQPDSFSPPSLACRVNTSASYILYVQINADYASCPTAAQIISRQTQASTQASSSLIQPRPSTTREPQPSTTRLLAISPSNQTDANPRRRAPSRRPILRPPT